MSLLRSMPPKSGTEATSQGSANTSSLGSIALSTPSGNSNADLIQAIQQLQQVMGAMLGAIQKGTGASSPGSPIFTPNISITGLRFIDVVPLNESNNVAANAPFVQFTAPTSGRAYVFFQLNNASVVNLVVTPANGSAGPAGAIDSGNTIAADQPFTFDFPVSEGSSYQLQTAKAQDGPLMSSVEMIAK